MYLEVCQKYSAAHLIFKSVLSVWKCSKYGLSCLIYYLTTSDGFNFKQPIRLQNLPLISNICRLKIDIPTTVTGGFINLIDI